MSAMNALVPKETFELVARQLGTHVSFVEKDWYVTQALKAISSIQDPEFKLVFSGGTALSKAHKLIQRFSEDIDFIVSTQDENHTRKSRSSLKNRVVKSLKNAGFKIEKENVQARNENRFFAIDLEYSTYFDRPQALRPHIQIEMTIKPTQLAPVALSVASLVSELSKTDSEVEKITCMSVVENAADKLSALTWRIPDRIRGSKDDDPSVIRHVYDLAVLREHIGKQSLFKKLVKKCMKADVDRIKNKSELVKLSAKERFEELLNCLEADLEYSSDYDRFVRGVCYSPEDKIPDFDVAVESIRSLIESVT